MRTSIIIMMACSLLMACQQSPRKNYYLLSGPTPQISSTSKITQSIGITQTIGIGPIELPDYLQRSQMVRHYDSNSLNMADNHYWAEPLDKGIVRILALHLTQRDNSRIVLPFPWRGDSKPNLSLRLHIHDLKLIDGHASINSTWELFDNTQKKSLQQQHFIRSLKTPNNAIGMASAYSELFAQLADDMEQALNSPKP